MGHALQNVLEHTTGRKQLYLQGAFMGKGTQGEEGSLSFLWVLAGGLYVPWRIDAAQQRLKSPALCGGGGTHQGSDRSRGRKLETKCQNGGGGGLLVKITEGRANLWAGPLHGWASQRRGWVGFGRGERSVSK